MEISRLDQEIFPLEKESEPTLYDRGMNKLVLMLDYGRFTGGNKLFGESFEVRFVLKQNAMA